MRLQDEREPTNAPQEPKMTTEKHRRRKRHVFLRIDSWIDSTLWNLGFKLAEAWEEITIFFRRFRARGWKAPGTFHSAV